MTAHERHAFSIQQHVRTNIKEHFKAEYYLFDLCEYQWSRNVRFKSLTAELYTAQPRLPLRLIVYHSKASISLV